MKKMMILLSGAVLSFAACADTVFPSAGGSTDIASPAAWGLEQLPEETETVLFGDGIYQASADVCFGVLKHQSWNAGALVFDVSSERTLSFAGFNYDGGAASSTNWFKGGMFDFRNGEFVVQGASSPVCYGQNRWVFVSGGARLTNISKVTTVKTNIGGNGFWIDGEGSLFSHTGEFRLTERGPRCRFLVTNGGAYSGTGTFYLSHLGSWKTSYFPSTNRLEVVGNGSSFSLTGSLLAAADGDGIEVRDGASMSVGGMSLGYLNTCDKGIFARIEGDNTTFTSAGNVEVAGVAIADGSDNRFEVLSGATATVNGTFYAGGSAADTCGGTLFISNATFNCNSIVVTEADKSYGNRIVLSGKDAVFNFKPANSSARMIFRGGPGGEFVVENGASYDWQSGTASDGFSYNGTTVTGGYSVQCTLRARAQGKLTGAKLHTGHTSGANATSGCVSNRIEAVDGGSVEVAELSAADLYGVIAVSNGAIRAKTLTIGRNTVTGTLSTNCLFEVAGAAADVVVTNSLSVINGSSLRFVLPDESYAADTIPVKVTGTSSGNGAGLADGCRLEIANVAAACEGANRRGVRKITLLQAKAINVPAAALAEANASIAGYGQLAVESVGNKQNLTLKFKGNGGLMLIFR